MKLSARRTAGEFGYNWDFAWATQARVSCRMEAVVFNLVNSATASASELKKKELIAGAEKLRFKAERYQPRIITILGISAYRIAFGQARVELGLQGESLGPSALWVLPNPSGLNAHYTPASLTAVFRRLRMFIDERSPGR
jgi:TDG/mug DNA glycosylase family protein